MDEHELLVRHLVGWAEGKKRLVDPDLVSRALALRWRHDELEAGAWPPGSVERLLLTTWPAYGDDVADPDSLVESLDTLWRFLRATGRMRAHSVSPAQLRAEARRAARQMHEALEDPARHSAGRVLQDFGRSIGITLDGVEDTDELQARLDRIQGAWNALPQAERVRLMPDPSPKSYTGQRFTSMVQHARTPQELDEGADPLPLRGDPQLAADDARGARFVRSCLELATWVGEGREVTSIGVLRPAIGRDAYRHLDLWTWERELDRFPGIESRARDSEVDSLMAEAALNSWTSAGDCLPLDRLWYSVVYAGIVEVSGRTAHTSAVVPESDREWLRLAFGLILGMCVRLGPHAIEPVVRALDFLMGEEEDEVPIQTLREWWLSGAPRSWSVDAEFMHELWRDRLDRAMFHFDDTGLWQRDETTVRLTDLGREFGPVLVNAADTGLLSDDPEP